MPASLTLLGFCSGFGFGFETGAGAGSGAFGGVGGVGGRAGSGRSQASPASSSASTSKWEPKNMIGRFRLFSRRLRAYEAIGFA